MRLIIFFLFESAAGCDLLVMLVNLAFLLLSGKFLINFLTPTISIWRSISFKSKFIPFSPQESSIWTVSNLVAHQLYKLDVYSFQFIPIFTYINMTILHKLEVYSCQLFHANFYGFRLHLKIWKVLSFNSLFSSISYDYLILCQDKWNSNTQYNRTAN